MSNVLGAKDPDRPTEYALDPRAEIVVPMRRNWPYSVGAISKAVRHSGFYYDCIEAGETSARPAKLSTTPGVDTQDGSLKWRCLHPSSASLPSISSVSWAVAGDDDELEVSNYRIEDGILYPLLVGGTEGIEYEVTAQIVWSTGQQQDMTVVIPVESQ